MRSILALLSSPSSLCLPCLHGLQLLVLKLSFQLLRLRQLAHSLVEVILIDRISVVFDCKQAPKQQNLVSPVRRSQITILS